MAQPYVGEVKMFAGTFYPNGWMFCEGQLLPISEYETLFQLIGTTYGGDGEQTFALPDLRGRLPLHRGNGFILAETGGAEEITLSVQQIPAHNHALLAAGSATSRSPENMLPAKAQEDHYADYDPDQTAQLDLSAVTPAGGSQPHSNFQPYLCVHFIISLYGIFPSPT